MFWTIMLLAVGICGILGFYDSLYGFGELMRMINSGILILLALGLLLRTWVKRNIGKTEKLIEKNLELERRVEELCRTTQDQKNETVSPRR